MKLKISYEKSKHWRHIQNKKVILTIYLVLRILVVATMVAQFFNGNYENVMLCVLTLVLFMLPSFCERRLHIDLPDTLEVIVLLFIFSAEILGEIQEFYILIPGWDTVLHTLNGFLCAAIGFSIVNILNEDKRTSMHLSPLYMAVKAFCFSMTIGVLWEFFEFSMDQFTGSDMQKDFFISAVNSVALNPNGLNEVVSLPDIQKTVVYYMDNGEQVSYVMNGGYLDVGILDTMKDLMVNCLGALVFSAIGIVYIKNRGRGKVAQSFIPQLKTEEEIEAAKADLEMQKLKLQLKKEEIRSARKQKKE